MVTSPRVNFFTAKRTLGTFELPGDMSNERRTDLPLFGLLKIFPDRRCFSSHNFTFHSLPQSASTPLLTYLLLCYLSLLFNNKQL